MSVEVGSDVPQRAPGDMKTLLEHPLAAAPAGMSRAGVPGAGMPRELSLGGRAGRALELRELRYFHSVARTGNFGRAARELHIGQPNVTQQVQRLEQELGTQLLIRHGRGVTLTQAGTCLMDRIDVILGLLSAPLEPAPAPERTAGILALGLPPEAAPLLAPRMLQACRARWPGLSLTIREGSSAALEEWVLDRRVDIAVLQDPPALDDLDSEPVASERLGLVSDVRTGSGDRAEAVKLRELTGLKLILPEPRHWIRRLVESAVFRRGVLLDQVQQADGVALTKEMVRNGLGCTVLPLAAVRDEVARGALTYRAIEHDPLITVHAVACRRVDEPSGFTTGVRRLLHEVMSGLAASGEWAGASAVGTPARCAGTAGSRVLEVAIE